MTSLLAVVLCVLLISPCAYGLAGSMSGLKVSGNKIVNGAGQTVRLIGINRSGVEFSCIQSGVFADGPMDSASVDNMLKWNINVVRVPFNEDCWLARNGAKMGGATYQASLKTYVDLLTSKGLAVILDLHWSETSALGAATGQTPLPDPSYATALWAGVAGAYKGYSNVLFDLFNEPYPGSNYNCDGSSTTSQWTCWQLGSTAGGTNGCDSKYTGMKDMLAAVRGTGATNIVLMGGLMYSACVDQWSKYVPADSLNNVAVSIHLYKTHTCDTQSCWDSWIKPLSLTKAIVTGEIGQYDCASDMITSYMNWADALGISYLGWTWNTWDCGSGPALISNYDGTATTFGAGFKSHIAGLTLWSGGSTATTTSTATTAKATTTTTTSTATTAKATATTTATTTTAKTTTTTTTKAATTTTTGTTTGSSSATVIYADAYMNGWVSYSYGTYGTVTTPVHTGTQALSLLVSNYGALYFHSGSTFTAGSKTSLSFYIYGGQSGSQPLQVIAYSNAGTVVGTTYALPAITNGQWVLKTVAISSFGLSSTQILQGFAIQAATSGSAGTVYVDDVSLL